MLDEVIICRLINTKLLGVSGIYMITNLTNGKIYIGSSINVLKRVYRHKLDLCKNKHYNRLLQRAWNKYGEVNFLAHAIEYCDEKILLEKEQYYLDKYKSYDITIGYNIMQSCLPGMARIPEHIKKQISAKNTGRVITEKTREKLKAAHTDEHKKKMSILSKSLDSNICKIKSEQTHCIHGHEFTKENTKIYFRKDTGNKVRQCSECLINRAKANSEKRSMFRKLTKDVNPKKVKTTCKLDHDLTFTKIGSYCKTCAHDQYIKKQEKNPKKGTPCGRVPSDFCKNNHKYTFSLSGKKRCNICSNANQRDRRRGKV